MNTAPQLLKHDRKAGNLNLFVHVKIVITFNMGNLQAEKGLYFGDNICVFKFQN
jgi:hypothetical protein